jgi:hypothetical protein
MSAFNNIPVEEETQRLLAYCVPGIGIVQPTKMPFGILNGPAFNQRDMERTLEKVRHNDWIAI